VIHEKEKESNSTKWHWTSKVLEISTKDKTRILEKFNSSDPFDSFNQKNINYVVYSFDLSKINHPQQYRVVFYITDYYVLSHFYCTLVDITNWVMIPPPEYNISANPNSITLRPGERSSIELNVKGNVNLPTSAFYISDDAISASSCDENNKSKNAEKFNICFIQNNVSIPASGTGLSAAEISVPDGYNGTTGMSYTIPITTNISFPSTITNRGGESFSNSKAQSIYADSKLTLTVLPPYTFEQQLNNVVTSWITPISCMWSFLAGVAAVLTPVIIKLYNNKKKKDNESKDINEQNTS
jgi:hypothetical protein